MPGWPSAALAPSPATAPGRRLELLVGRTRSRSTAMILQKPRRHWWQICPITSRSRCCLHLLAELPASARVLGHGPSRSRRPARCHPGLQDLWGAQCQGRLLRSGASRAGEWQDHVFWPVPKMNRGWCALIATEMPTPAAGSLGNLRGLPTYSSRLSTPPLPNAARRYGRHWRVTLAAVPPRSGTPRRRYRPGAARRKARRRRLRPAGPRSRYWLLTTFSAGAVPLPVSGKA